jgi:hypothetical protein
LAGAFWLFVFSLVPMLAMLVPVLLILGQLSLWYQARPLRVGEDAVVTLKLNDSAGPPWADVQLRPADAVEVTLGPIRVLSKGEVCWNIRARANGYHRLAFETGGQAVEKELAVGDGFMRVSPLRPGWSWSDVLLYPWEPPFRPDAPVQSIDIVYPERSSWTSGTDAWVIYWFVVSMVAAFVFRPLLKVNI